MKRQNIKMSRHLRKNQTDAEKKLWRLLRNRCLGGVKFRRQFPAGNYILDFYSPEHKLGIELDGGQHYSEGGILKDKVREKALLRLGIRVIRFGDNDVMGNVEGVCERIMAIIKEIKTPPHLNPLPGGERKEHLLPSGEKEGMRGIKWNAPHLAPLPAGERK